MGLFSGGKSTSEFGFSKGIRNRTGNLGLNAAQNATNRINQFADSELPTLGLNKFGFFKGTEPAINALSRSFFSRASANAANKGQLTPQNTSSVAGSALVNSLPFLIPQIQSNIQTSTLLPEQLRTNRLGLLSNTPSFFSPFGAGGTSETKGPNLFGKALASGFGSFFRGLGSLPFSGKLGFKTIKGAG